LQLNKDQAMPEIYIYAVEGRTMDQKRSLVKDVTDAVVRHFQVTPGDVMVQIMETPKTSKAKGGILFSDRPGEQGAPVGPKAGT
jgi:4-oxalocrotonate tautomerase